MSEFGKYLSHHPTCMYMYVRDWQISFPPSHEHVPVPVSVSAVFIAQHTVFSMIHMQLYNVMYNVYVCLKLNIHVLTGFS